MRRIGSCVYGHSRKVTLTLRKTFRARGRRPYAKVSALLRRDLTLHRNFTEDLGYVIAAEAVAAASRADENLRRCRLALMWQ